MGCEGETFNKSALTRPSALLPLPAGSACDCSRALAIFEQNAQRIGIRDSGDDRDLRRLLPSLLVVVVLRPVPRCDRDSDGRECQPVHTLESFRNGCDYTSVEID